ncbi:outer membrane beta-barrel protein [Tenacibaculum amylolyticum]|uniref:outer membrane beta-barrel protein n=1 Tax=Tenacibaculum amylolyticum TaxID=104269 RepID=UPI003896241D
MKKFLLTIAMVAFGFAANAQDGEFNVGGNIGLPTGDASDAFDIVGSIEANYLFNVAEGFKVGPSVSYIQFNREAADISFLPVAAAARYSVSEKFVVGADLGYGIGMINDTDSGFYYRPMVGYEVYENISLQATFAGFSLDGATASTVGLGATYSF